MVWYRKLCTKSALMTMLLLNFASANPQTQDMDCVLDALERSKGSYDASGDALSAVNDMIPFIYDFSANGAGVNSINYEASGRRFATWTINGNKSIFTNFDSNGGSMGSVEATIHCSRRKANNTIYLVERWLMRDLGSTPNGNNTGEWEVRQERYIGRERIRGEMRARKAGTTDAFVLVARFTARKR
jgi:hypothetical protein